MASMSAQSRKLRGKQVVGDAASLTRKINKMKKQIEAERLSFVKEKVQENKSKVESYGSHHLSLAKTRLEDSSMHNNGLGNMLSSRIENPLRLIRPQAPVPCDNGNRDDEVVISVTAKLPVVENLPRYTTWTFLKRNRRMVEDDSMLVAKQPIPYDKIGGKARPNNEEENTKPHEEKHEFSLAEKRIIRMACRGYEPSEEVLRILTRHIGGTTSEIQEMYNILKKEDEEKPDENVSLPSEVEHDLSMLLEKSLTSCLDSFDTLFCRQCLVFDCSLHGYGQPVITPAERRQYPRVPEEDKQPCGDNCYLHSQAAMKYPERGDSGLNSCEWKPLEIDLFLKGVEIFGQNSCLITRNLLSGFKTCIQVYTYMQNGGLAMAQKSSTAPDDNRRTSIHYEEQEMSLASQVRRKGKAKKLKHPSKSGGGASASGRIADGKDELEKHYTPCQCKSTCGKECPCLQNHTYCEKYCGCSKSCKYRFAGCHCTTNQCRNQQCACFAAGRECDPDICWNCWVSCGDGSLGEPSRGRGGDGSYGESSRTQCRNMNILLHQHQKFLLGISNVAGWGAFLKKSVNKDDYLGEYTGELISHEEAGLRGVGYDKKDSSYLFDVNNEQVLDALRQGNKLKFANHSLNPNCYAKIVKVKGDHHVAIFAKEPMEAGQEIFYDYCYKPEAAPAWARKPDNDGQGQVNGPGQGQGDGPKEDSLAPPSQANKHQPPQ